MLLIYQELLVIFKDAERRAAENKRLFGKTDEFKFPSKESVILLEALKELNISSKISTLYDELPNEIDARKFAPYGMMHGTIESVKSVHTLSKKYAIPKKEARKILNETKSWFVITARCRCILAPRFNLSILYI